MSFDLLNNYPRTGCQSIIVFATDGIDTDGEQIRCGPGKHALSNFTPTVLSNDSKFDLFIRVYKDLFT